MAASHQPRSLELVQSTAVQDLAVASPPATSSRLPCLKKLKRLESERQPSEMHVLGARIRSSQDVHIQMSIPAAATSSRLVMSAAVMLCEAQTPASAAIPIPAQLHLSEETVQLERR